MRISGLHVDGYGILSGVDVAHLPPGLSVISGPNEAGKSTLLDFLRGVLFGFPDRRSKLPYRPPLRGGRHGGRLDLLDDSGRAWSLTRYVGSRAPLLVGPDGRERGSDELSALLGGVDGEVFRSVFAFGLTELVSLHTLDSEAVRDAVFSAGVLGAGRSASEAAGALRARRDALARPRQRDAPANRLAAELAELDESLRRARREAAGHHGRRVELERAEEEVRSARAEADALRRQLGELDRLIACWPLHCRAESARRELAALGPLPAHERALLAARGAVEQLLDERSGHHERVRRAGELSTQLAGIERQRAELLSTLAVLGALEHGDEPSPAVAGPARSASSPSRGAAEPASRLVGEARRLASEEAAALASSAAQRAELERALDAIGTHLADLEPPPAVAPRPAAELDAVERSIGELASELAERERLLAGHAAARQHELERAVQRLATTAAPRRLASVALAAVLVAAGALAALALHDLHRGPLPIAEASLAAALTLAALLVAVALRRVVGRPEAAATGRHDLAQPGDPAWWAAAVASCEARVDQLGAALGLERPVSPAQLNAVLALVQQERSVRLRLDAEARERARLEAAAGSSRRRVAQCDATLAELARRAQALASSAALSPTLGIEELVRALDAAVQLDQLEGARRRVAASLGELEQQTAGFERRVGELWERLAGPERAEPSDAAPRGVAPVPDAPAVLGELQRRLRAALERHEATAKLERALTEAEEELARQLGAGEAPSRLRAELERGELLGWEQALDEVSERLEAATRRHESAVAARHELRCRLDELERSSEIADLELRCGVLSEQLDAVLQDWLAYGLAEALLDATLARYEREHQPRVVARAGELFAQVTDGRYERLVARSDGEGQRAHAIDAVTWRGERVDSAALSRGTAEQLYLCLRLAYASTVAERGCALPIVLDDVLVNFDPGRARAAAAAIAATARRHQVLAFTCHPDAAAMMLEVAGDGVLVELERSGPASAA